MSEDTVGKAVEASVEAVQVEQKEEEKLEYVTIPAVDIYDEIYPMFQINRDKYESGMTHLVAPVVATELREMIARFEKSRVRLMQRSPDSRSLKQATGSPINQLPV